jgi:hypothetical protein
MFLQWHEQHKSFSARLLHIFSFGRAFSARLVIFLLPFYFGLERPPHFTTSSPLPIALHMRKMSAAGLL